MMFVSTRVVQVEWADATADPRWLELDAARDQTLKVMYTVGYLFEVTEHAVKLFMTQSGEDDCVLGVLKIIPRSQIRAIRHLHPGPRLSASHLRRTR